MVAIERFVDEGLFAEDCLASDALVLLVEVEGPGPSLLIHFFRRKLLAILILGAHGAHETRRATLTHGLVKRRLPDSEPDLGPLLPFNASLGTLALSYHVRRIIERA